MNRGVITYSLAYIIGICIANYINNSFLISFLISITFLLLSYITKRKAIVFYIFSHLSIFMAGNCAAIESINPLINLNSNKGYNYTVRQKISSYFKNFIPDNPQHSTLCALALGSKQDMSYSLKQSYKQAGAMHVLALSGLHIGIIYSIFSALLMVLNINYKTKLLKLVISIIMIFFYAYLTGLSPSVVRASIMILIYRLSSYYGIKNKPIDTIAAALLAVAVIWPSQVTSIGFQLSFAAVAGITFLFPICSQSITIVLSNFKSKCFPKPMKAIVKCIFNLLAISVCCQITTLPITLYYFKFSSSFFLITNIVAIPLVTAILYTLIPTILLSGIPLIGNIFCVFLNFLLKSLNYIVEFIA